MNHLLAFNMEILSTETIKPSTPTPFHLKHQPLSYLDQHLAWLEYRTPLVLFYSATKTTTNHHHLIHRLKASLATTLSLFYPLAGRLSSAGDNTILCDDHGVPVLVARAKYTLASFLTASNRVELVPHFLPHQQFFLVGPTTRSGWVPLAVQLTLFECGSIAIGSHVLHKASIDGISRAHFINTWAAITAGRYNDVVRPDFKAAISLFRPSRGPGGPITGAISKPLVLGPLDNEPAQESETCTVKAFGFSNRSIAALQSMGRGKDNVLNPTRVEAVSAFLWKHLMAAVVAVNSSITSEKQSKRNQSVLIHSVNMRPHIHPPVPPQAFGKFTTHAIIHCDISNNGTIPNVVELVTMIRKAFLDTKDVEFVSKFHGEGGEEATRQHGQKLAELKRHPSNSTYIFASWNGLDVDFGLGMPVWVGVMGGKVNHWFKNFVPLVHVPGYGIEAWLVLDEKEMSILESDSEFLAFASPCTTSIYSPKSSL